MSGRKKDKDASASACPTPTPLDRPTVALACDVGDGMYSYTPAGEAHHQSAIRELLAPVLAQDSSASHLPTVAELAADPENAYDANAIQILIDDRLVGFIRAYDTEWVHPILDRLPDRRMPVHAVVVSMYDGDALVEAGVRIDVSIDRLTELGHEDELPSLTPAPPWEPNHTIASLQAGIRAREELVDWMGTGFADERPRLRKEIRQAKKELETERARVSAETALNDEISDALTGFQQAANRFRETATIPEVIGLGSFRDGDAGRCHLCGGWTDSGDNRGRADTDFARVLPGPSFPTDDHVVPQSSLALSMEEVYRPNPDPVVMAAWNAVHDKANIKTAHFVCNSRKGARRLEDLALPFTRPEGYDEVEILGRRGLYEGIRSRWRRCRDLVTVSYVVCGDPAVNATRKVLKQRVNETWDYATDDSGSLPCPPNVRSPGTLR